MTEKTETAYHEAGHAVTLYACGFDVGDASITPGGGSLGRVGTPFDEALADRLDMLEYMGDDGKEFARRRIMVAFSGVAAVEILTGLSHDVRSSLDTYTEVAGSDWSHLNRWMPIVAKPKDYQAVYDQALARSEHVLRENWSAVVAVAEALLEHGELDAAAVRSILEEAFDLQVYPPDGRVVASTTLDRLHERLGDLLEEGDPENQMESVQEQIRDIHRQREELHGGENA